ncbi:MAG TPA: asparaginase [Jatrophihabitans sp.]|jgi:L-asparaginase|nr:asparaginase [Jatrophihabitans sp.]
MTTEPHIAYFALGGTISMSGDPRGGVVPRLSGTELVDALGALPVEVRVHDPVAVPGGSLTFADVLDVVDAARAAVNEGAVGVVLTQGTDTLEETAFLIDSIWEHEAPFVLTGAMRNPTLLGAEGPANLLAAIRVASSADARGRGALVAFLDDIHAARHVVKSHTTSPATFVSPDLGPVGHVVEGTPRFLATVPPRRPIAGWTRGRIAQTNIALYTTTLDDDGLLLAGPDHSHQGLVVAGFGVGHVPARLVPALVEINEVMPVVLASRTGSGSVLTDTYGAPGSERDLLARGLINGRFVHPYKARVLLRLLVAGCATRAEIASAFAALG